MDKVYGTEAARLLGVSRSTMLRMDRRQELPADGTDPDGARYWLRSTLHAFISGKPTTGTMLCLSSSVVRGLAVPEKRVEAMVRWSVVSHASVATSPTAAFLEIVSLLSATKASGICIGSTFAATPCFGMLAAYAAENGLALLICSDI